MAATNDALGLLHDALARAFGDVLTNGVKQMSKDGALETVTAPAAYLNTIRQFLKDNGIECAKGHPSVPLRAVVSKLPFAGSEHAANRADIK